MAEKKVAGTIKAAFVLFAVLLLASAAVMVVALQDASPKIKSDANVDAEAVLQALLSSTVSEVSYTDLNGLTTIYKSWTVQALLVEDMAIRSNSSAEANLTGLSEGIEQTISGILDEIAGDHHFNMKVSFRNRFFKIMDLNIEGGAQTISTFKTKSLDGQITVKLSMTE